jgi:5'-deoxynucleotidase YfbR-like HD superfamily hydrolase
MAAATHDLAEQAAGDVPAPAKWAGGFGRALDDYEHSFLERFKLVFKIEPEDNFVLNMADAMAGMLYCCREAALGNRSARLIYEKWRVHLLKLQSTNKNEALKAIPVNSLLEAIHEIWEESNDTQGSQFDVYAS